MGRCPECGDEYEFSIPSRLDNFAVSEFYRHTAYGRVYFHPIVYGED